MTKPVRLFWSVLMATFMTSIPHIAWAEMAQEMIPTSVVINEMSRDQARATIESHLSRAEVRSELGQRGVAPEEVSLRLASLSDQELKRMAKQMDEAMYGGDSVVGILVVVLLVLLIIYLVKRV